MTLSANLRQFRNDHRGAALVEFTVLAPLLISLMCGLAEFGQALRQYHIMEKGVRDAARYLSRVPGNICPPVNPGDPPVDPAWASTYVPQAKNLAVYGVTTTGTPLFQSWTNTATVSVPNPPCLPNPRGVLASDLPKITVTASAPYADLGMLSFLGLGPITLTVSHEELKVS